MTAGGATAMVRRNFFHVCTTAYGAATPMIVHCVFFDASSPMTTMIERFANEAGETLLQPPDEGPRPRQRVIKTKKRKTNRPKQRGISTREIDMPRNETAATKLSTARELILTGSGPVSITTIKHHRAALDHMDFDSAVSPGE
jgi:hypothetical protein